MGPERLRDLPSVTQLVPDFVFFVVLPKQVQKHFTPSISTQGLGFTVSLVPSEEHPESGEGGGEGVW